MDRHRCKVLPSVLPMQTTEASLSRTWVGEDPRRDVGPCAHDVLDVQTGLQTSLSCSLGAHNPVHLSEVLEAAAKHAHELGQVCGVEILLQELGENTRARATKQRGRIINGCC